MTQLNPDKILNEIENFDYPIRDWSFKDAKELVEQGILTHYFGTNLSKNIEKLKELKEKLTFKPPCQKGILLTAENPAEKYWKSNLHGRNNF